MTDAPYREPPPPTRAEFDAIAARVAELEKKPPPSPKEKEAFVLRGKHVAVAGVVVLIACTLMAGAVHDCMNECGMRTSLKAVLALVGFLGAIASYATLFTGLNKRWPGGVA